jgi:ribosome modulation factor
MLSPAAVPNLTAAGPPFSGVYMGISADSAFLKLSSIKSKLLVEAFEAVESSQRALCEGRLAGFDGQSALHNPYARGELREKWFAGHTEGKRMAMGRE